MLLLLPMLLLLVATALAALLALEQQLRDGCMGGVKFVPQNKDELQRSICETQSRMQELGRSKINEQVGVHPKLMAPALAPVFL